MFRSHERISNFNVEKCGVCFSISDGRALYVGYFPASRTISVVVVNPFQNKELSPSIIEKQFREACEALSIEPPQPRNGISFKVNYLFFLLISFQDFFFLLLAVASVLIVFPFVLVLSWTTLDMLRMLKNFFKELLMSTGLSLL